MKMWSTVSWGWCVCVCVYMCTQFSESLDNSLSAETLCYLSLCLQIQDLAHSRCFIRVYGMDTLLVADK